ncbi:MAG: M56 family metallopeptidase [Pirellulaceae bacterium]
MAHGLMFVPWRTEIALLPRMDGVSRIDSPGTMAMVAERPIAASESADETKAIGMSDVLRDDDAGAAFIAQFAPDDAYRDTTTIEPSAKIQASSFAPAAVAQGEHIEANSPAAESNSISQLATWITMLATCWLTGCITILAKWVLQYRRLCCSVAQAEPAPASWSASWQQVTSAVRQRPVPMLVHDDIGPLLCLTPVGYRLVVPSNFWSAISQRQRHAVLLHEAAHLQRNDILWSLLANIIAALHWFNPCVWHALRRHSEAAEWCCDDTVRHDPSRHTLEYARLLLELVEVGQPRIGYTAIGGAELSRRIRRLLESVPRAASPWRQRLLVLVLSTTSLFGLLRMEIGPNKVIAGGDVGSNDGSETNLPGVSATDPEAATRERLRQFADELVTADDPRMKAFQEQLTTESAAIVAMDRASWVADELRRSSEGESLVKFLQDHFRKNGDRVEARDAQWSASFIRKHNAYQADVRQIATVLGTIAQNIAIERDEDRLLQRVLTDDFAPSILYMERLRNQLQPDVMTVYDRLGDVFIADGNQFVIRGSRRADAEQLVANLQAATEFEHRLRADLPTFTEDFSETDQQAQRFKALLNSDVFFGKTAFDVSRELRESRQPVQVFLDRAFEQLEWIVVDGPDGLRINSEQTERVEELFKEAERLGEATERLRQPFAAFAERIAPIDPLHESFRAIMLTPAARVGFAGDYEVGVTTPEQAFRELLSEVTVTQDDGRLRIADEHAEEFANHAGEIFRMARTLKRKLRPVDELAARVTDPALRNAMSDVIGKLVFVEEVKQAQARERIDALALWIDKYFVKTPEGYRVQEESIDEIEGFWSRSDRCKSKRRNTIFSYADKG